MNQTQTKQIGLMLNIIHQKSKYPKDFNFNGLEQGEYENLIISYRRVKFKFKSFLKSFSKGFICIIQNNCKKE